MPLIRSEPGRVWRLILDRPDRRNAVSLAMMRELDAGLAAAAADPGTRVIVLAGAGSHFCAGADVAELLEVGGGPGARDYGQAFEEVLRAIAEHPVPVLAEVHGAALGAGCQLVAACDLAVAAEDARIGIPSSRLGIVINLENIERLVGSVGPKRAGELLFTGRELSGVEAAAWGVVNASVPPADLGAAAAALAAAVADGAPLSVRGSKLGIRAVLEGRTAGVREDARTFGETVAEALGSSDLREGLAAFRERRRPEFRGS